MVPTEKSSVRLKKASWVFYFLAEVFGSEYVRVQIVSPLVSLLGDSSPYMGLCTWLSLKGSWNLIQDLLCDDCCRVMIGTRILMPFGFSLLDI